MEQRNYSELVLHNRRSKYPEYWHDFVAYTCFNIKQKEDGHWMLYNLDHIPVQVVCKCGDFSTMEDAVDYALDVLKPIYDAWYNREWGSPYLCPEYVNDFDKWVERTGFKY